MSVKVPPTSMPLTRRVRAADAVLWAGFAPTAPASLLTPLPGRHAHGTPASAIGDL
jgi:hypothetical protein